MTSVFGLRMYVRPPISQIGNVLPANGARARRRSLITCCFRFTCRRSYRPSSGSGGSRTAALKGLAPRGRAARFETAAGGDLGTAGGDLGTAADGFLGTAADGALGTAAAAAAVADSGGL